MPMATAKPKPRKSQQKVQEKVQAREPAARPRLAPKPDPKPDMLLLNGIPLRRKSVWVIDTESPQFRAARKRDAQALKAAGEERDSQQFLDAVLAQKDVETWWK
jgi:hypothetical protein